MLVSFILFVILLTLLLFLSQKITGFFYSFFFFITKSQRFSVGLLSFFLLPGTIIHEMSHFFMATILFVPTGKLTVLPIMEKDNKIRSGRLEIAQTDPFRRSAIGLAPMFTGLTLIYLIGRHLLPSFQPTTNPSTLLRTSNQQLTIIFSLFAICYLLFTISTTMFSSPKDTESLVIVVPIILLLFLLMQYVGVKIVIGEEFITNINKILSQMNFYLLLANLLDYCIFLMIGINQYFWRKVRKN